MAQVGEVKMMRNLERIIGVISYARRAIVDVEAILGPLREALKEWKAARVLTAWMQGLNEKVAAAFRAALDNMRWLTLPGAKAESYVFTIESDWSTGHAAYMLFAKRGDEERLIDLGSRSSGLKGSSYLGELDAIQWACKRTKALRGSVPLVIRTDNQSVVERMKAGHLNDADVRALRRWGWLVANEPGFQVEFIAGDANRGADLLSRPKGTRMTTRRAAPVMVRHREDTEESL